MVEYAAHRGVGKPYVSQLKRDGRLVLVGDGKRQQVDFAASDRLIRRTEQLGSAANGANAGGRGRPDDDGGAQERVGAVYRQSQAQHKAYTAKLSELEYRRKAGLSMDRAATIRGVTDAFRELKLECFAVPRRCAGAVLGARDVREAEKMIDTEIRAAFDNFERRILLKMQIKVAA